jgi:hypothetical protein
MKLELKNEEAEDLRSPDDSHVEALGHGDPSLVENGLEARDLGGCQRTILDLSGERSERLDHDRIIPDLRLCDFSYLGLVIEVIWPEALTVITVPAWIV